MKQYILIALAIGIGSYAQANVFKAGINLLTAAKEYPKDTSIGFELVNKSDSTLYVVVRSGSQYSLSEGGVTVAEIKPGYTEQQELDTGYDTAIAIWKNKHPGMTPVLIDTARPGGFRFSSMAPLPDALYTFPENKTIYLTYDNNGPRPETGPLGGSLKKTDTGLSLANNVTSMDILPVNASR